MRELNLPPSLFGKQKLAAQAFALGKNVCIVGPPGSGKVKTHARGCAYVYICVCLQVRVRVEVF
jgi:DNA replication protein DnaC